MRIAIDARFLGLANTGLARYSENLLHAMARIESKHEFVVFVNARLERKLKLGENWRVVPLRGHPISLAGFRRIERALSRESIDVFYSHFPLAPLGFDIPSLITVHDILPYLREAGLLTKMLPLVRLLWAYILYPFSLRKARWIICVSNTTRDQLVKLFPWVYHKSFVVASGVNEHFLIPEQGSTLELIRKRLELPEQFVLYSGSTREDKNIEGILRVFAKLRQSRPQYGGLKLILDLTGESQNLSTIRKRLDQYDLTEEVLILEDMSDEERRVLFEDARALMILSRQEGFGFPILEAQVCDTPVVAADAGALPEVAGENGAVLVDPDNLEDCVAMLDRVLTDETLRDYLIKHGRANAERYQWEATAKRIHQVLDLLFYPQDLIEMQTRDRLPIRMIQWLRF